MKKVEDDQLSVDQFKSQKKKIMKLLEVKKYEEANVGLESILEFDPYDTWALKLAAVTTNQNNKNEKALSYLRRVIVFADLEDDEKKEFIDLITTIKSELLTDDAIEKMENDDFETAIDYLEEALILSPDDYDIQSHLMKCYYSLKDYIPTLILIDKLLNQLDDAQEKCRLILKKARCYTKIGDFDNMEKCLNFVIENGDENILPELQYESSVIAFKKGDFITSQKHIDEFDQTIAQTKGSSTEAKREIKNAILVARICILIALKKDKEAKSLVFSFTDNFLTAEYSESDFNVIEIIYLALNYYKEYQYLSKLADSKIIKEKVLEFTYLIKATVDIANGTYEDALANLLQFKEGLKRRWELDGDAFDEMWLEMRDQKDNEYDDFTIPDLDQPFGAYIDNTIDELQSLIAKEK